MATLANLLRVGNPLSRVNAEANAFSVPQLPSQPVRLT